MAPDVARILLVVAEDLDGVLRLQEELDAVVPGEFDLVHELTPSDACRRLSVRSVDAILLDLSSSENRDLHAVEAVLAFAAHAPVVVLTQRTDDDAALAAVHLGAQECLTKGDDSPRVLARVIRHAVERSRLRRELYEARAAEAHRATHDALTGLANRSLFLDRLGLQLQQAERENGKLGVAFVDLNHFKAVNDRLGHAAGDALLKHVGEALERGIRAGDTVARFGGDEFAILLHDVSEHADVQRVLDALRIRVESEPTPAEAGHMPLSLSMGWAVFPLDSRTAEGLLAVADAQMYAEKRLQHAQAAERSMGAGRWPRARSDDAGPADGTGRSAQNPREANERH